MEVGLNALQKVIVENNLDAVKVLNWLSELGVISDNVITAADVWAAHVAANLLRRDWPNWKIRGFVGGSENDA